MNYLVGHHRCVERPDRFVLNPFSPIYDGLVLGPVDAASSVGSMDYRDSSPFGNHGTLTNMEPASDWVWDDELGRWGLDFDGSNDNVTGLTLCDPPLSAFCWIRSADFGTATRRRGIISNSNAGNLRWSFQHNSSVGVTTIQLRAWDAAGTLIGGAGVGGGTPVVDVPQLVGVTIDANEVVTVYLNGVPGTPATRAGIGASTAGGGSVGRGEAYGCTKIFDPFCWSRVISSSEIAALADPANPLLAVGGCPLILPGRRTIFASATAPGALWQPHWTNRTRRVIGGGVA